MTRSLLLFVVTLLAAIQDPPKAPDPKVDLYGDPLPRGAVARLGTLRFRHVEDVCAVAFEPDGKVLMAVDYGFIYWWNVATGAPARPPVKREGRGFTAAFSGDLKRFATGEFKKADGWMMGVYDSATGRLIRAFTENFKGQPISVSLSADGSLLASTGTDGQAYVWNVSSGDRVAALEGHEGNVISVAFSPDGKFIATAGDDKTIRLWNPRTGASSCRIDTPFRFYNLAVSKDGTRIAAGSSEDRAARVWDVSGLKELYRLPNKDEVNFHPIFPGDGSELVVISSGVTTFHDAATGRESRRIAGGGYSGALSADGLRFAAGAGPQVRLWDARTGVLSHDERPSIRYGNVLWFSPDDSTLKVFGGTIQAWDCATGKLRSSVEISKYTMWFGFSPDGRHYARSGGVDRKVTVHASADDREVGQAAAMGNNTWVTSLALANDLKRLAVGDRNPPSVHVFDLETGAEIRTLKEKDGGNLAFSPDGALLAVEGKDGWIHVLNPATGELKHSLQADPFKVGALRFSPDGRRLIAATQGKGLQVWSAESGDALLGMPSNGIMGEPFMAVSPDGRYLAGPYDHRQVKVWEAATAGEVMTIDPARGYVQMLAISNGGSRLAIQTQDGNIVLWNLLSPGEDRGAAKVEELWDDLASKDAVKAYAAVCALALKGGAVAPFLKERLIHRPPDAATIRKWVRGLADEDIEARHRALSELRRVDAAADYLKIMAEKDCPAEAAAALRSLLNDAGGRRLDDADRRRRVRAIWALDRGGAPEAADLLREITEVVTDARVREEAALSLSRVHVRK